MDRVVCPQCGYRVGLGMAAEVGTCPSCEVPLVLTCEMRALTKADLRREVERQRRLAADRRKLPLV
jgi:transcription initiation factor IIE alpha subunit